MIKHLEENNTSYFSHLIRAWSCSVALFIHGILPWFFIDYASNKLQEGHDP
jgi:hypothetical protein